MWRFLAVLWSFFHSCLLPNFFPATLPHPLFFHPPSIHFVIYFLVYRYILLFPKSYIIFFWEFSFLPFSVHLTHTVPDFISYFLQIKTKEYPCTAGTKLHFEKCCLKYVAPSLYENNVSAKRFWRQTLWRPSPLNNTQRITRSCRIWASRKLAENTASLCTIIPCGCEKTVVSIFKLGQNKWRQVVSS
jgi:hypothetical protein